MSIKTNTTENFQKTEEKLSNDYVAKQLNFKLYDVYGSICYEGPDYNKAMEKVRWLPFMFALYVFDENNKEIGVVWAARNSGLSVININSILLN